MTYRALIPNMLTSSNLVFGVCSIFSTMKGDLFWGSLFILIALVADGLDGRAARFFGTSSEIGKEMDSLCDLVSFGVAPGILAYVFCLHAHTLGIKIFVVKDIVMQHRLGEPVTRMFLGHRIILRNYSPNRLYGIYRNNILLIRKYPQFTYIKDDFKGWLKNVVWVLLFESNKTRKFISILRGCLAGLTKRL